MERTLKKQPYKLKRPEAKPEPSKVSASASSSVKVSLMREPNQIDAMTSDLIKELLNASVSIHELHLSITGPSSYARHMALNEAYDALPDAVDTVAEGYQGACAVILKYPNKAPVPLEDVDQCVKYIGELCMKVEALQEVMPHSEVTNNLDLIKDILNKLKYKLLFLS